MRPKTSKLRDYNSSIALRMDISAIEQMADDMVYLRNSEEDEIYELQAQSIIDSLLAYLLMKKELLKILSGDSGKEE